MAAMLNTEGLSQSENYLLALSGGRDSVCLLHLLLDAGIRKLHLVHLNHQLRGAESDADAEFVKQLAEAFKLRLTLQKTDIAEIAAESKRSLESAARLARHSLFRDVARATGCNQVLLAHHADDQAETILFNLLRGSAGLKGMKPRTTITIGGDSLTLLRPLLQTRRSEIDAYLAKHKIKFREDSSNTDLDFTRNRLRHEALPLLADILARDVVPTLSRSAEIGQDQAEIIADLLNPLDLLDPLGRLFLPKVRELSPPLQRAALRDFLVRNDVKQLSHDLIHKACALVLPDGPAKLNLPGNRFLRRKEARLFIGANS